MEDYEYRVINSQATLFQITSKFTSKNYPEPLLGVYIGGGPWGGSTPTSLLPGLYSPPHRAQELQVPQGPLVAFGSKPFWE